MRMTFLGAAGTVTGSEYLLEHRHLARTVWMSGAKKVPGLSDSFIPKDRYFPTC